ATLVALDKRTGAVVWKCAVPGGDLADYSAAVAAEIAGVRQYVQRLGKGLVGVAAKDGRLLWRAEKGTNQGINTATPVVRGDQAFCCGAYGRPSVLVKIRPDGDGFRAEEVYSSAARLHNWHTGPVLVGDHLYADSGSGPVCVAWATGEVAWKVRGPGGPGASVLYA